MKAKKSAYFHTSNKKSSPSVSGKLQVKHSNRYFDNLYDKIMFLQRTIGNQAVGRFLKSTVMHPGNNLQDIPFRSTSTGFTIQRKPDQRNYSEDCSPYIGSGVKSCEFYKCREANTGNKCGKRGYYLGYGLKYCKRFNLVTRKKLSKAGKKWLDKTTKCLQEYIHNNIPWDESCKKVKKKAFNSHPRCYLKSGICSLPIRDMLHIFLTVDPDDIELKQIIMTGIGCGIRWLSITDKGLRLVGRGLIEQGRMGLGKE